ncbi:SHOCT domain-containing protein [Massilia oculi]|uniref:SHOCT domain-containing protein n=1 Tax=Massilia hydrophila TaxID=3044279 RepID=A0ABS7YAL4_9BURK|nr:SHOCT domain-containing protein [Massilia oculi]MCA1856735.1 SHOCT domain-containing protein [Massilia oculi]
MFGRLGAKLGFVAVIGLMTGCATSDIVPMGTDTYMIAQTSAGGMFKAMSSLKTEVIQRANQFAENKGKVAIPVASKETLARPGQMPSFEYQFRLVDRSDPRASGSALIPRADIVVENNVTASIERSSPASGQSKDVYVELLKLEELRKKGILNDAEFQAQKERILKTQ